MLPMIAVGHDYAATREVAMRHSQELAAGVRHVTERTQPSRQSCRMFSRTDHFRSDRVVKRDPGLSQLGRKCCAELVFQTPDQRITKRVEVRSLNSEICMLPTRVPDDRLKQFMLIKCPNDCRDHVHELEVLSFHVAREHTLRIGKARRTGDRTAPRLCVGRARSHRTSVE